MGQIEIAFRRPEYRGRDLAFPSESELYGGRQAGLCNIGLIDCSEQPTYCVRQTEFDPMFDYNRFQQDIFSLIDPVEESLRQVELNPGITGEAVLGYSTFPVIISRFWRGDQKVRTLYPIAFKISLRYRDDVVGKLERESVVAVVPRALGVAVVSEGVDHTGNNLLAETRDVVRRYAAKVFNGRVDVHHFEPIGSLKENRASFAYWELSDIESNRKLVASI